MPTISFANQSSKDKDNSAANTSRLVNCYLEPVGGRAPTVMKSVLGMTLFAEIPGVFATAANHVNDAIFIVLGGKLYEVDEGGTITERGTVAVSDDTTISSNDGNVTVVADGRYFVWDGATLAEPAAGAFSDFGSVSYFGSLTVLTERNGNRVQWSDVFDPKTLGGLSFATADAYPDNILRGEAVGGSFWIFKEESIERWFQNGADLAPVAGGAIEYGLKAYGLLAKVPNGAFFVSSENKVQLLSAGARPISTRAVETSLAQEAPTHCFFYQDEGHDICVIRFADRPAWCYDIATGLWHERAEGEFDDPWTAVESVKAWGDWHVVTELGNTYKMERTNSDYGTPLVRQATGNTLYNGGSRFRVPRFEVQARIGHSNLGRDAILNLEVSRDHGQTWTDPKSRTLSEIGDYDRRVIWRSLGACRQFTPRLTWTDAAELPIDNAAMVDVA